MAGGSQIVNKFEVVIIFIKCALILKSIISLFLYYAHEAQVNWMEVCDQTEGKLQVLS